MQTEGDSVGDSYLHLLKMYLYFTGPFQNYPKLGGVICLTCNSVKGELTDKIKSAVLSFPFKLFRVHLMLKKCWMHVLFL